MLLVAQLLNAGAMPPVPSAPNAHPALLTAASAQPRALVSVIVQTTQPEATAWLVTRLGGTVTHDLSMIRSLGVTMPSRAAVALAQAPGVRWVALDAPTQSSSTTCADCPAILAALKSMVGSYSRTTGASKLWLRYPNPIQGQGIAVAVVDSGVRHLPDLARAGGVGASRVVADVAIRADGTAGDASDLWGHGTHIAGIIAGNGAQSYGAQVGMAPQANIVNVKVGNDTGGASVADVIAGLQWIYRNKTTYNIRVVNLSLTSTIVEPASTSALSAAVQALWFNGIVVVVAGGNSGRTASGVLYPPANDPFVISVGALDDRNTVSTADDVLASFSAYGQTAEKVKKPDLVAPGTNIISLLASKDALLARDHPTHFVDGFNGARDYYFRMSGTSMSSAVTAGAVALLLQDEPNLTPDQVKQRLISTARPMKGSGYGAGALDIYSATISASTKSANQGQMINRLLWPSTTPVQWSATNWSATNWSATNWSATNWSSIYWGP
jgi:serine protease AprX